jgi:hypothetical protein
MIETPRNFVAVKILIFISYLQKNKKAGDKNRRLFYLIRALIFCNSCLI